MDLHPEQAGENNSEGQEETEGEVNGKLEIYPGNPEDKAKGKVPFVITISQIARHNGEQVGIRGWLYNRRSSGKILFLQIRDGTGFIQGVLVRGAVDDELFSTVEKLPVESSLLIRGLVRQDRRAPGGYELDVRDLQVIETSDEYPLAVKEHGVDFLMEHRHLWLRTPRQTAILRIRSEVFRACEDFLQGRGFVRVDSPILTPAACEGTTNLFQTDFFGQAAYLTQSGQLYAEAAAMALGKVYCLGPTFRAEKSKTRRHLMEFWMIEPEAAFMQHEENMRLQEEMVAYVVERVLERRRAELDRLERDRSGLEQVKTPFPRITYDEALRMLAEAGLDLEWGDDFGSPHETYLAGYFKRPVFVERYPARTKAFYMQPDPDRPDLVLCDDLLAPEGYGEIIGGSERISDYDLLLQRIREHNLPEDAFAWYLDLRRYGSVPHAGFGLGLERTIAWICGLDHVREAIPFPRTLTRIYP